MASFPSSRAGAAVGFILAAALHGCSGASLEMSPSSRPAEASTAQAGQLNVAVPASYSSELPWKAVLLLVSYVSLEAVKQSWIVFLSHRREIVRLKK